MRTPRLWVCLAGLAGLLLFPPALLRAAAPGDDLERHTTVLENLSLPDDQRVASRTALVGLFLRSGPELGQRLLQRAEAATNDNVRMQYAIILDQVQRGRRVLPPALAPAATELLTKWFGTEGADAALRYWAAVALADTQDPKVLALLKPPVVGQDGDVVLRIGLTRALAGWRGDALAKQVVPLLIGLLSDKSPDVRIAACDALRLTDLNEEAVVEPVIAIAQNDPDERVWRAAATVLRRLGGGSLIIPPAASDADRKQRIQNWVNIWKSKRRVEERTGKGE